MMAHDTNPCGGCGHPHADHSRLAGCLAQSCTCAAFMPRAIRPTPTAAEAAQATDDAVVQVEQPEDSAAFIAAAEQALNALAATDDAFTTDDLWQRLHDAGVPEPREPRALGAVIRRARRDGLIHQHGWATSKRRHQAPVPVYSGREL